jgi:PadR family transcriptional regulator PadR
LESSEQKWDVQFRKGSLEMAILALLHQQPLFGLQILHKLHQFDSLQITDGTLYPLLDRLKREAVIDSFWQQEGEDRPRKYYRLSAVGTEKLNALKARWQQSVDDINTLFAQSGLATPRL